jgi:hypothetical protein
MLGTELATKNKESQSNGCIRVRLRSKHSAHSTKDLLPLAVHRGPRRKSDTTANRNCSRPMWPALLMSRRQKLRGIPDKCFRLHVIAEVWRV